MVDIYPMDIMVWFIKDDEGNYSLINEFIAVFVSPKDNGVMKLLGKAKRISPIQL